VALERAVAAVVKAKSPTKRPSKSRLKSKLSARDKFILESLEHNHLPPEVQKRYLAILPQKARPFLTATPPKETVQERTLRRRAEKAEAVLAKRDKRLEPLKTKKKLKSTKAHAKKLQEDRRKLIIKEDRATKKGLGPAADTEDLKSIFPSLVKKIDQPRAPKSEPQKLLIRSDHRVPMLVANITDARAAAKMFASFASSDAKRYTASLPILAKRKNAGSNAKKTRKGGLYVGWEGTHGEAQTITELEDRIFETIKAAFELGNGEPIIIEGVHLNERK
jgi:hypothetical protein